MNITSKEPLALAFIGGALDSAVGYAHFSACMMDKEWQLVAGCFSHDPTINADTGRTYVVDPARVYCTWQSLLEKEKGKLDAVVVLTPTPTHCDIVTACLREGFPTICEKALAVSSTEVRRIIGARNAANGFLAVTFNYSGYPMVRELRALIRKGALGKLLHFQVEMPQEGFLRVDAHGKKPAPQPWRLSDGPVPTIHLDLGVHLHHLVYYLTGQTPTEVISDQDSYGWFDVVDNVSALCRCSKGMKGQVWFSKSALGHRNGLRLRIYGSEGSAEWFQAQPEELQLCFADGRRQTFDRAAGVEVASLPRYTRFKAGHPAGFIEAFANLYADIATCVRSYKSHGEWKSDEVFTAELAANGLEVCEAMVASCREHSWQAVGSRS